MSFQIAAGVSGSDLDELSQILSTSQCQMTVTALDRTPTTFRANFNSANGISIADCAYTGSLRVERKGRSERVLIFLPIHGNASFDDGRSQTLSIPGQGTIIEAAHNNITNLFGPRHHLGFFIDQTKLRNHLTQLLERTITGSIDFHPQIDLTAGSGLVLAQLAQSVRAGLASDGPFRRSPIVLASLWDSISHLIIETLPNRYSDELARPAPAPAPRHVKHAIDFIHERIAEPISLHDIATAAKVSGRTLNQGFRQFRNTTPMSYLREIRMVAAHHDLLAAHSNEAVADIAMKWGFTHLGRFAAEYKKRFGLLPSQVLKR